MSGQCNNERDESVREIVLGKPEGKKSFGRARRRWGLLLKRNFRK
jgi:hypothetical protein